MKKVTILGNDASHQHTLHGEFEVTNNDDRFKVIDVKKDSLLKHETPSGEKAEHETLKIGIGTWVQGEQVEFNPFDNSVSKVWD